MLQYINIYRYLKYNISLKKLNFNLKDREALKNYNILYKLILIFKFDLLNKKYL
jgi:hypothetical protein